LIVMATFGGSAWTLADTEPACSGEIVPRDDADEREDGEPSLESYLKRAARWHEEREYDKAIADYDRAIALAPKRIYIYWDRADAWYEKREYAKALADLDRAIEINPRYLEGYAGRAWVRAACPDAQFRDGAKAVQDATEVCKLSDWKTAASLDTLAVAYAEAGQFDEAVKWQKKAIELVAPDRLERYRARLKLYEKKTPYRDP
ncbi:MAG: tetratricopeptide repeat protein, partial [Patescibacteria group bacterium]|nr:tetratricopeptide repeat protein [Patescibacteria group bacterium]